VSTRAAYGGLIAPSSHLVDGAAAYGVAMGWRLGLGAVLVLIGAVWFFQGIGVLGGSSMTGDSTWTVIGAVCVIGGVALVATGLRMRGSGGDG
jgi:hypothetical protein